MRRIAHIINPVNVKTSSDLVTAQPITFETIRLAKEFARTRVDVRLLSAQYPEDSPFVPQGFTLTPDLDRSIIDYGQFEVRRKLPLIQDILDRLYEAATDAEYLVYTNVDIALMPYFYVTVSKIAEVGYDAFVINRRTISKEYTRPDQLYLMFSQVGEIHPGYDCFVFKRSLYPKFELGNACIGANWIGRILITNLICRSRRFMVFEDLHLTFHIGDERTWKVPRYQDYDTHNEKELYRILSEYKTKGLFQDRPLVESFLQDIEKSRRRCNHKSLPRKYRMVSFLKAQLRKYIHETK